MSLFRNDSLSNLFARAFVFTKDEQEIVWTQDNNCFLITKEEANDLIDGLKKYIELVDDNEINDHNSKILYKYEKKLRG
jgi:hypothetical protein